MWERGAPELAVELVSDSDASESAWAAKLQRYRRLGVRELVRFDCEASESGLRVWDRNSVLHDTNRERCEVGNFACHVLERSVRLNREDVQPRRTADGADDHEFLRGIDR